MRFNPSSFSLPVRILLLQHHSSKWEEDVRVLSEGESGVKEVLQHLVLPVCHVGAMVQGLNAEQNIPANENL